MKMMSPTSFQMMPPMNIAMMISVLTTPTLMTLMMMMIEMLPELPSMMITIQGMKLSLLTPQQSLEKTCHHMRTLMMFNNNRMMTKGWCPLLQIHNTSNWIQHLSSNQVRMQEWTWIWKTQEWTQLETQQWICWRIRDMN